MSRVTDDHFQWLKDCQGKEDYDGTLLSVSSRYWPGNYRDDGRPSAESQIIFLGSTIAEKDFDGDTKQEVQQAVEAWVSEKVEEFRESFTRAPVSVTNDPRVVALIEAARAYAAAEEALANREYMGINAESHEKLQPRVHAARRDLDAALANLEKKE